MQPKITRPSKARVNNFRAKIFERYASLEASTRRGDTLIEVMFAIAVFSLVAVLTIAMMNLGTANAEGALELTTARHELNAQAEALRFVHSSYTAELALPTCSAEMLKNNEKCQQYKELWEAITKQAHSPSDRYINNIINITDTLNNNDVDQSQYKTSLNTTAYGCARAYESIPAFGGGLAGGPTLLTETNAFVLNVRDLNITSKNDSSALELPSRALIPANTKVENPFRAAPYGARIIYSHGQDTTDDGLAAGDKYSGKVYNKVSSVEGLWIVGVRSATETTVSGVSQPVFYDFYIQSCWNPPNSKSPTILDTVIRLYNPGAKK